MKFTASRLSDGNKLFAASITTEDTGLKVRLPGFWKNQEAFLPYSNISGVTVDTPLVGYSTITFNAMGEIASAHGFTKSEVKKIKQLIEIGKSRENDQPTYNEKYSFSDERENDNNLDNVGFTRSEVTQMKQLIEQGLSKEPVSSIEIDNFPTVANSGAGTNFFGFLKSTFDSTQNNANLQREKIKEEKKNERQMVEGKIEDIAQIEFGVTIDSIANQLSQLLTLGNAKPDKNVKKAIIEKLEFGIMKLKRLNAVAEADYFEKKVEPLKKKSWL